MHFTSNQKQALIFITAVFLLAVGYRTLDKALHPVEAYNFTPFEEKFYARLDSIEKVLAADSLALNNGAVLAGSLNESAGSIKQNISGIQKNPPAASREKSLAPGQLININTATIDELTLLPRIGPKTAARIVEYRTLNGNFAAKKDIMNVKGIGTKMYENLKDLITVE